MPLRIYCNGVFDLCHIGHIKQFEQAYTLGDVIVGVHSDEDVATYKRTPIQTTIERTETVRLMKFVSEVIIDAPLITTNKFMQEHNLDLVLISPEYDTENDHYYTEPRNANKVIVGNRYPHMSTSIIISRIKLMEN
jgi:cytidyltransferase-like protein